MRALLVREARRLAPYGLGGAVVTGGMRAYGVDLGVDAFVGACAAAALLGVAAFAPDTARGGTVFLRTLPLSSGRVAALKIAVALAWAVPASAPLALSYANWHVGAAIATPALGFGAGVLASAVSHRVTPALLVAPLLALLTALAAVALPMLALRIEPRFAPLTLCALATVCTGLAGLAFARGDRHRPNPRPALIAAAGLAPAWVLTFAGVAAAHAWTLEHVVPGALRVRGAVTAPGGPLVVSLGAEVWSGHEARVVVLEDERPWRVPVEDAGLQAVSPDGRFVLLRDLQDGGGWVVDLTARTATRLAALDAAVGLGDVDAAWGPDGLVALVRGLTSIEAFHPRPDGYVRATRALPPSTRYVGLADDGRALLTDEAGVLACALPGADDASPAAAPERLIEWPAGLTCDQAEPARGGRLFVQDHAGDVHVVDLRAGRAVPLAFGAEQRPLLDRATLSPDLTRAAFTGRDAVVMIVDLASGERLFDAAPPAAQRTWIWGGQGAGPVWSPDGQAVAMPWGPVVYLGAHPAGQRPCADAAPHAHDRVAPPAIAAFVGQRVLLRGAPLSLATPFTGQAPVALDLPGGAR